MTIDEILVFDSFKNPFTGKSRRFAQEALYEGENPLFAYETNFWLTPSNAALRPESVWRLKNKTYGVFVITDRRVYTCTSTPFGSREIKELPLYQIQSIDAVSSFLGAQLRIKGLTEYFVIDVSSTMAKRLGEIKGIIVDAMQKLRDERAPDSKTVSTAADELLKLKELVDAGLLSKEEFDEQKRKILSQK